MERFRQFLMIIFINSIRAIYSVLPNDMNCTGCNQRNSYELNTVDFYALVTAANNAILHILGLCQILLSRIDPSRAMSTFTLCHFSLTTVR